MSEKAKQRICKNPNKNCGYVFETNETNQNTNVCPECGFTNERKFVIEEARKKMEKK